MLKLYVFICRSFFWVGHNFHALCPSVSEAFQSCCGVSDLPRASENPECSGGHTKTRAADVKEPLTNVSLWALDFYFGEGAQVTVPGDLMAPFLNGIIFSSGSKWSDALWGPRCCQTVHKLTRKAVASAFPRPLGAVMFTTPRPPVLTPAATPWPVGAAIRHCSSSTSVKGKKENIPSEKAWVILASDPLIVCWVFNWIEFFHQYLVGVLWPSWAHLKIQEAQDVKESSWTETTESLHTLAWKWPLEAL